MRSYILLAVLGLGTLGACTKHADENQAFCAGGRFDGDATGALPAKAVAKLTEAISAGADVRVKVTFLAADKDSANTDFWFKPVAVSVLRSVVYAESAPLKWPPTRYSWQIDSTAVGNIPIRASSDGKLSWVQGDGSAKTESAPISWCVN